MRAGANVSGFTLIEVVVGLVLMASLVIGAMVSLAAHRHQWIIAKEKQQANGIVDRLLTQWFEVQGRVPTRAQGVLDGQVEWAWQTQVIGSADVCGLTVDVIRVDVLGRIGPEKAPKVLSSIEIVQAPNASGLR